MGKVKTRPYDPANHIETAEDVMLFLEAVAEDGDASDFVKAVGDIARFKGMAELASKANVSRESLYRSLSAEGNPSYATMAKVLDALGLRFAIVEKTPA